MRKIEIIYHRPILGKKVHRVDMPTSWNELNSQQVMTIGGLLHARETDIYLFRIHALKCLLAMTMSQIIMIKERLVDLFPYVAFLEEENTLTINPIASIQIKGSTLYGPIGNFETLTAGEWTEADNAYIDYRQDGKEESLDRLVAILYRPKVDDLTPFSPDWGGDWRQIYNDFQISQRLPLVKGVDKATKFAILLWYQGCRQEWEDVFARVFKGTAEQVENFGWQETLQKISGDTFGNLRETEKTPMYKLLLNMEITMKDEEIRKQKVKAQNNRHAH